MTSGLPSRHPEAGLPTSVTVYEVGPRDGLQAERSVVPTEHKVAFIRDLLAAGLPVVEATSFVSPRRVPQLADAGDVLEALADLDPHPVLVPNSTGLDRALAAGARTVAVFVSATETFAKRNVNATRGEALARAVSVVEAATALGVRARGYVSMCFGDPWEGDVEPAAVAELSRVLVDAGCY